MMYEITQFSFYSPFNTSLIREIHQTVSLPGVSNQQIDNSSFNLFNSTQLTRQRSRPCLTYRVLVNQRNQTRNRSSTPNNEAKP